MNNARISYQKLMTLVWLELSVIRAGRWTLISCLAFCAILTLELFLTSKEHNAFRETVEASHQAERLNWLNQGNRSPHGAAHHGTYLFKPPSFLSVYDPGLFPYLGTTLRAEAHVRHRLTNRPAETEVQPMRNALTTPSELVQGILPLLIILLGCGCIAREREQITLPLVLSQGIPWCLMTVGKISALFIVAILLASPYIVGLIATIASLLQVSFNIDQVFRATCLLLMTFAYLVFWCCFVVGVSARAHSVQVALSVLLIFWSVTTFCLPSFTTSLVSVANALPSQEQVAEWSNQKKYGNETGGNLFRKIREDLEEEMLAKHQVQSVEELPFHFDGLVMLESEKVTDQFYQQDAEQLSTLQQPFEQAVRMISFASPSVAMHQLTMTLAGTDEQHHKHFDEAAESYRQHLVKVVNEADTQKNSPDALRGERLWRSVKEFHYQLPSLINIAGSLWGPVLALGVWLSASIVIVSKAPKTA